jgi:hypothetical protein
MAGANGKECPDPTGVRRWIEQRRQLPGTYVVGSRRSAHYMTVTRNAAPTAIVSTLSRGEAFRSST